MSEIVNIDKIVCEHIAKENCIIKYEVVMKGERESGLREVLNLWHTMGNVIALLKKADLPTAILSYIDRDDLVKKLYTDKKVKNGQLRFVI